MAHKAPGRHYREGITLMQLADMFPDEAAARTWFEGLVWPDGRYCPRCGSTRTHEASHAKSPYRCTDCRSYFSVKAGTLAEASKVPLRKWVFAIYLEATSLSSPLKKASLTGFHATAKHIAAKAVSPSSETMRTI